MKKLILLSLLSALTFGSCTFEKVVPLPVGCTSTMFYETDIKPFMDAKCSVCHNSTPTYMSAADFTNFNILKEKIDNGSFKNRVFNIKDMAPTGYDQLTAEELGKLRCWLDQGSPNN